MSHDTPIIVADNHIAQVMNASPEYLGHNPESVLQISPLQLFIFTLNTGSKTHMDFFTKKLFICDT